jgi:enamine deaminase RidA (YjgF/YER057c/UK114 family)
MPDFIRDVPGLCTPPEPYSYAVKVGNTLHLAGQVALNEKTQIVGRTLSEQAEQVWKNIDIVLRHCGSDISKIVKINYFLQDIRELPAEISIRRRLFSNGQFPAVTAVQVSALGLQGLMLEVEVTAEVSIG